MNILELKERLENENFNPLMYSVGRHRKADGYCIEQKKNAWHVYHLERGVINEEWMFGQEDAACSYFYEYLKGDPTTRKGLPTYRELHPEEFKTPWRDLWQKITGKK